jgi:hypothetical protein
MTETENCKNKFFLLEFLYKESAPPGMEDLVLKLKKQYPDDHSKAFATAWKIYNKKHHSKKKSKSSK